MEALVGMRGARDHEVDLGVQAVGAALGTRGAPLVVEDSLVHPWAEPGAS